MSDTSSSLNLLNKDDDDNDPVADGDGDGEDDLLMKMLEKK